MTTTPNTTTPQPQIDPIDVLKRFLAVAPNFGQDGDALTEIMYDAGTAVMQAAQRSDAPTTETEIGDGAESGLEQLSDPWHIREAATDCQFPEEESIRDSNGLPVTHAQVIRCKVERDHAVEMCFYVRRALNSGREIDGDDLRLKLNTLCDDIDRHEDGL